MCFGPGFILGLAVPHRPAPRPESPRWLCIHGYEDEAEEVTRDIERQVGESTGEPLPEPEEDSITIQQRKSIGLWEITSAIVRRYLERFVLGLALFIGQAFLYSSILFGYATLLSTFFHVATADAPYYLVAFAVGNLVGPIVLHAIGTGIGGIIGPQRFGRLVPTGNASDVLIALAIGAILMIIGGVAEIPLRRER